MKPVPRRPTYTNALAASASLYLRQHAHNPVDWHPWGEEAVSRARAENKPILLSIGYSACYWCHVMEREVFENPSIAALMNKTFINIKIDREEHPDLDEIYMLARQLMTREGGWPNNVWLTPELKPFYAGGTFAPDESYGKPAFPRLIEWIDYHWQTQQKDVRENSEEIAGLMSNYLVAKSAGAEPQNINAQASRLFGLLKEHYDARAGGFFQAPKFPHENYLQFLLTYYWINGDAKALDMVTHSLARMAAGGLYDHVGCGFHRYAVDKEWYVPHFEKMLYNQAQLARLYTDAAALSKSEYLTDIAKSILDFSLGPFSDGNGGFYAAFDAETDGVEGVYYAWTAEELQSLLTPEENTFFTMFYALADIPAFPGHKHTDGQVIVARKPLDAAARERNMPYVQLAAMAGKIMNKLLAARNKRQAPELDDKIIVGWNGLMIDAYAHAGAVFKLPHYIQRARKAADFILEHAIDNDGNLHRMYAGGKAHIAATLEDYAYLIKGLLSLLRAQPDEEMLSAAVSLMRRCDELFYDANGGYFFTQVSNLIWLRAKNGDDSAVPNANAIMLENCTGFFELTGHEDYRARAQSLASFFLKNKPQTMPESATMISAALRLERLSNAGAQTSEALGFTHHPPIPDDVAMARAELLEDELTVTLELAEGWHVNPNMVAEPYLIATQLDVQGAEILSVIYPESRQKNDLMLPIWEGRIVIRAKLQFSEPREPVKIMLRFQPCRGTNCHAARDISLVL